MRAFFAPVSPRVRPVKLSYSCRRLSFQFQHEKSDLPWYLVLLMPHARKGLVSETARVRTNTALAYFTVLTIQYLLGTTVQYDTHTYQRIHINI
jgi:hypothetical protein